jgi:hypothetical protein
VSMDDFHAIVLLGIAIAIVVTFILWRLFP